MKISAEEFRKSPQKAITFLGMSGAGKTHLACQLEAWGWMNYSCDYEIGSKYMKDALQGGGAFSSANIEALATYLGKLGDPAKGGHPRALFEERQRAYYNAEVQAVSHMREALADTEKHFVHDSTGSLCEIEDDALIDDIGQKTLFVYLKISPEQENIVLDRAQKYPKPLFFPKDFLAEKVEEYLALHDMRHAEDMDPDAFARWVFPHLFEARKPKYQRLADQYGVTIPADNFWQVSSPEAFVEIVAQALERSGHD